MKVDIEHEQKEVKDGWFKTRTVFVCKVNVVLSEEERQIIIDKQLFDLVLMHREPRATEAPGVVKEFPKSRYNLTINHVFTNDCSYDFENIARAKDYERNVIEALKVMKNRMEDSMDTGKKTIEI